MGGGGARNSSIVEMHKKVVERGAPEQVAI
jgi:hypothetical protein